MRNLARVLAFDVAVPIAIIAGLLTIGVMLGWPLWWVSVCSILCFMVLQAVVVNIVGFRRDAVTMGTDDDAPGLRLAAVAVAAGVLAAAVFVGYTRWTVPDRDFTRDSAEVVGIASTVAEATASFSPDQPDSALDRAAELMDPQRAEAFRAQFAATAKDLARRKVSAQGQTVSAGLEVLGPAAASVAVLVRATQSAPREKPSTAVLALRVTLAKGDDGWLVVDVVPINSR